VVAKLSKAAISGVQRRTVTGTTIGLNEVPPSRR
jgi:hypothetical protein